MDTAIPRVPRPLRRDAELNRQRILAAARDVFAERGLEATLDEVARRAGLGVGTVYRRFPNKEALVEALFEEGLATVLSLTERALQDPDAWDGLAGLLTELAELQAADFGLRDVMLGESFGNDRVARMRDRLKPMMDELVENAQRQGGLRPDFTGRDIPAVLLMVSTMVEFTRAVRPRGWRRYLTMLLDGMCACRERASALPEPDLDDEDLHEAMRAWPRYRRPAASQGAQ
ncbi:MAG: TetR/AcrR family transcriptional regulator [Actinocrinis sp.]